MSLPLGVAKNQNSSSLSFYPLLILHVYSEKRRVMLQIFASSKTVKSKHIHLRAGPISERLTLSQHKQELLQDPAANEPKFSYFWDLPIGPRRQVS